MKLLYKIENINLEYHSNNNDTKILKNLTPNFLSKKFYCTNLTIIRNIKKELGVKKYEELNNRIKSKKD